MGFDMRLAVGALFAPPGLLLGGFGLFGGPVASARSLGIDVDLWWGIVLLLFGLALLGGWRRAVRGRPPVSAFMLALAAGFCVPPALRAAEQWAGYERMTRATLEAALAHARPGTPADLRAKNLTNLDLRGVDFRGANLSASVFNGAQLEHARFDRANLTVAFLEGANLTGATLRGATLFSTQLGGSTLAGADLTGARLIGDLRKTDLRGAKFVHVNGAADMRNQSMGLMRANLGDARAQQADFTNADFSRADFSFADLTGAKLVHTLLVRADLGGATLAHADLTGADLRDAELIDTDFSHANLSGADFTGATFRNPRGLDTAVKTGARGLP